MERRSSSLITAKFDATSPTRNKDDECSEDRPWRPRRNISKRHGQTSSRSFFVVGLEITRNQASSVVNHAIRPPKSTWPSCDTFAPLGPVLCAGYEWSRGRIETRVNGSVVQSGSFSELLFDPLKIVSHVSRHVTLMPGDVIYTGTPGHTSALKPGDIVEVDIEGIGILRNTVVAS